MRVFSLVVVLSTLVVGSACDRASASDEELGAQLTSDSAAAAVSAEPAAQPRVIVREVAPAPVEMQVVEKTHVKRDAAIGAGVGAAVGAIANDDNRLKGGIVGAVVGGAAGAIVGKTVDKEKVVVPR
jgi:hypothetical protein